MDDYRARQPLNEVVGEASRDLTRAIERIYEISSHKDVGDNKKRCIEIATDLKIMVGDLQDMMGSDQAKPPKKNKEQKPDRNNDKEDKAEFLEGLEGEED